MTRPKWIALLVLFVVSVVGAITLTHLTASHTFQGLTSSYQNSSPYAKTAYSEEVTDTEPSQRVGFPDNYAEQFVQYATVDCPHSRAVRKMYVNSTALETLALETSNTSDTIPSGTVLVMETHSADQSDDGRLTPTRLNNIFIREKRSGWQVNQESGEWKSAWYSPKGALISSSQDSCISCHTMVRDRDYLFTLPALLAAARTGVKQQQETEFGTSVCR